MRFHPRSRMRRQQGFTLLEMIVVLVIIGLIMGLVGPRLFGQADKAKVQTAATQTAANRAAIDQQHAAKYASEFLPKLKALPAPQPPAARGAAADAKGLTPTPKKPAPTPPAPKKRVMLDAETGRLTVVDLADPTTWCAHCREEAQKLAAR